MKTATIHNLHQHWIAAGKQPVVLFSSRDLHAHPNELSSAPVFGLSVLPTKQIGDNVQVSYIPIEIAGTNTAHNHEQNVSGVTRRATLRERLLAAIPSIALPSIAVPRLVLPRFRAPKFNFPTIAFPRLPEVPSVADFQAEIATWPWHRILHWGTRLAYGGAVAAVVLFLTPIVVLEGQSRLRQLQGHIASISLSSRQEPAPTVLEPTPTPEPEINNANDYFSVHLPRLNITSRIIPNVDTGSATDYEPALKLGVAHAKGTGLPDDTSENKTIYLFAHSTNAAFNIQRYNAQFYALKDSVAGDSIKLRYWGEDYEYVVEEIKIVDADDTSYLAPQTERELLILQTCYPPGTTWKRLVVIATRVQPDVSE